MSRTLRIDMTLAIDRIDAILPQTQCQQCGHSGCRPYATALAERRDEINKCPPGGEEGIRQLAALLGVEFKPFASDGPLPRPQAVAVIAEHDCIGCTLCIQACPVDAIVGAAKQMHTVIANECTGCELCMAPCPVDCITMHSVPLTNTSKDETATQRSVAQANHYRQRYQFRHFRLQRDNTEKAQRLAGMSRIFSRSSQANNEC